MASGSIGFSICFTEVRDCNAHTLSHWGVRIVTCKSVKKLMSLDSWHLRVINYIICNCLAEGWSSKLICYASLSVFSQMHSNCAHTPKLYKYDWGFWWLISANLVPLHHSFTTKHLQQNKEKKKVKNLKHN